MPGSHGMLESPYPRQYERHMFTRDGALLLIRPIKRQDGSLLVDFFSGLSPRTVFYRFLTCLKSLPPEWVEYFTRIDYERDVALVAVEKSASKERILGVCRIMRRPGSLKGEIAVVVSDPRQGSGIGSTLLEECIRIASELGMKSLWGLVSVENTKAQALAKKYGFTEKGQPELGSTELERIL
jgi:acetyltransferase